MFRGGKVPMRYSSWSEFAPYFWDDIVSTMTTPVEIKLPVIYKPSANAIHIKNVIFNDPATVVYWTDGSKTVVKCGKNDTFDKEKGLAMAIIKRLKNNKGNYNNIFRKWIKED